MTPSGSRSMPFETARGLLYGPIRFRRVNGEQCLVVPETVFEPHSSRVMERGTGRP